MNTGEYWRAMFENWPSTVPRRGLVITTFNESIPFITYMMSGGILLLERDRPDTVGARKVMIAYDAISAVKITDVVELANFQALGFQPPL
ncbi:MAG TPA: hypothetical protein VKU82_01990 [Planctomycetaceae bacterium]|nr:hypothetical protein [Planctomycetaceae bacterium]